MKILLSLSMLLIVFNITLFAEFQEGIIPDNIQEKTAVSSQSYDIPENIENTMENNPAISEYSKYILTAYLVIIIITIFLGAGESRKIVIFSDYDDLGLTFLIPASFMLIMIIVPYFGVDSDIGITIGLIVSAILTLMLVKNTYIANNGSILKTTLAFLTKFPLGIIWMINLLSLLNPSGKTGKERRQNRGSALVLLALLTPILMILVADKSGSFFNPKSWLKGKRIGSVRNHL